MKFDFRRKVMGKLLWVLSLLLSGATPNFGSAQSADECVNPMTQQLMNACAGRDYEIADAQLNAVWAPALTHAKSIGQGEVLLKVQRAWLAYRDDACEVHSSPFEGGSIRPVIEIGCLIVLTEARTEMLQEFYSYTLSPAEAEFDGLTAGLGTIQLCL
jgi:uncharacterized protein YecT (DUF1311 family)